MQKEILKISNNKGITLVALAVTIIVLMILAGVTIDVVLGDNGLVERAQITKNEADNVEQKEEARLEELKQQLELGAEGSWNGEVNEPKLLTGMSAIKFTTPTETQEGTVVKTNASDKEWYNYDERKWANAQTEDGSMWVWIPRYAYKITYYTDNTKTTVSTTKTSYGKIDVVFLKGASDTYYKEDGTIAIAQRQKTLDQTIDTTADYTVHPAFTNEKAINYANGGWERELTGIWVAKFEAGYASGNNTAPVKASSVKYTEPTSYVPKIETKTSDSRQPARNWLDGIYAKEDPNGTMNYRGTKYSWINEVSSIKYPTFQGTTYAMNYIDYNDCYNIAKALTESGNIYGLNSSNADSHLMKNSEWGAVAYLSQSKYGLNGKNIYINNVNLNNSTNSVYAVTGMAGNSPNAEEVITTIDAINNKTVNNVYTWKQANGEKASSTGTIYGIYDLSGGLWERTSSFVYNGNSNLNNFGNSLLNGGANTEYTMIYESNDSLETSINIASQKNYALNTKRYGDGIKETSLDGIGSTSWNNDYSLFPSLYGPFFTRSGAWSYKIGVGLFHYWRDDGTNYYTNGFRAVLVAK